MRRKIFNRISFKVFVISFIVQVLSSLFICYALYKQTPLSYYSYETELKELVEKLARVDTDEGGKMIDDFIQRSGLDILLLDGDKYISGNIAIITTISSYTLKTDKEMEELLIRDDYQSMGTYAFKFEDNNKRYILMYYIFRREENLFPQAVRDSVPFMIIVILVISLACSLIYTRLFAYPVKRLSRASKSMAQLDFNIKCDISRGDEIGDLARDLNAMSATLEQKIRELETEISKVKELESQRRMFFTAASHELKTPVTVLEGHIRGMIEGVGAYADHDTYLSRSLRTVKRMESLINEILTASKMQSADDVVMNKVHLDDLLSDKLKDFEDMFVVRNIKVQKETEKDIFFHGNRELTALAVGSFISNAVFYSTEGSKIVISSCVEGSKVEITVRNTDAQIDEEDLPHLFEPFYRADSSHNRKNGGSGLGLYIAKLIITKQNGDCVIRNTDGGVVAEIRLPLA